MQESPIDPEILVGHFVVERIWNQKGRPVGLIRVEIEETLGHYADWLGVTAWQIRRLNGFRYGRVLRLNEKIKIPLHLIGKEEPPKIDRDAQSITYGGKTERFGGNVYWEVFLMLIVHIRLCPDRTS